MTTAEVQITGLCGSTKKCFNCVSDFLCTLYAEACVALRDHGTPIPDDLAEYAERAKAEGAGRMEP